MSRNDSLGKPPNEKKSSFQKKACSFSLFTMDQHYAILVLTMYSSAYKDGLNVLILYVSFVWMNKVLFCMPVTCACLNVAMFFFVLPRPLKVVFLVSLVAWLDDDLHSLLLLLSMVLIAWIFFINVRKHTKMAINRVIHN